MKSAQLTSIFFIFLLIINQIENYLIIFTLYLVIFSNNTSAGLKLLNIITLRPSWNAFMEIKKAPI